MKRKGLVVDILFMLLLLEWYISALFIGFTAQNKLLHLTVLCVILTVMAITHFTSLAAGLIINILIFFSFFSYILFQSLTVKVNSSEGLMFWVIFFPLMTLTGGALFQGVNKLEKENEILSTRLQEFNLIEVSTGLKNTRAYHLELPVYQKLARRYQTGTTLMVWEFCYERDLKKMVGKERVRRAAMEISVKASESLRGEDVVYLFSDEPWQWGALFMTRGDNSAILSARMKKVFEQVDLMDELGENAPVIHMRMGIYYTENFDQSGDEILKAARKKMQYDVS